MLESRIIPCLLIRDGGVVKTVRFRDPTYIGDPINAVKIFNEKEVDEIIVLDIDASSEARAPNYKLIEQLANECRMPLCYGGGVKTSEQADRIFSLGVEKVAVSSSAIDNPLLVRELANRAGSQSVVVVVDVKRTRWGNRPEVWTDNARRNTKVAPAAWAQRMESLGAGEVVLNSIDQDGVMQGYDQDLVTSVRAAIHLPLTVLGGAGTLEHIGELIGRNEVVGAAAGSLFLFKGAYRAVLINYPNAQDRRALLRKHARPSWQRHST
ncbi:MAG: AglZ/HisF2 family acetamidino modification protein [Nannocystaceae bacterium]